MNDLEQVIAALLLERANHSEDKTFRGPYSLVLEIVKTYRLDPFEDAIENAVKFLESQGVARIHRYDGVEDYIVIEGNDLAFRAGMQISLGRRLPFDGETAGQHRIISTYYDVGGSWLHDYAMAVAKRLSEPEQADEVIHSSAWTGGYEVSAEHRARLIEVIEEMRVEVQQLDLSNADRSNALAAIDAIAALADAPDAGWQIILRILHSPILANVTALAALAVSIIKG